MKKFYLVAALVCLGLGLKAQDSLKIVQLEDIVVTGNKVETSIEKSGKTIFKLDRKQIEANRGKDVTDLLNEIPGVQIDGNFATPGTDIKYRIRGAESEQTLILIDGIPYTDPTGRQQTFDLRLLDLDQVESIEVLKGGASALYGTGAAAGVISITMKEESKKTFGGSINQEYGSFETSTSNANVSGTVNKFNYMISASVRTSDGFSAALDTIGNQGFDNDAFESQNFLGRFGYQATDQFSIDLMASYDDVTNDFDADSFEDDDSELNQNQLRLAISPRYTWTGGSIKGNLSYHTNERVFNQPNSSDPNVRDIRESNGNTFQADVILDQNLTNEIKLVSGVNLQRPVWDQKDTQGGTLTESFTMIDPYASLIYDLQNLNIQLGGRLNNHSDYGANFAWNVNPSYRISLGLNQIKVLGSYATAFRAPSLFELYSEGGFFSGNPDLEPQESETAEGGFEWISDKKLQLGAVYFYRKDENLIEFSFADATYSNIAGETEVDGLELNASYTFIPQLTLAGHYTYTRSLTDEVLLEGVPENKFGFTLSAFPIENLLLKVTHLHVGEVPEDSEVTIEAFDLFDGFASYRFDNGLSISASVNNIFDEEYVDRFGWATAERNYNIGIRYSF
ncbi:MAG: TonB-dependent receptor [Bacteroidota bacterium]